MGSGSSSFRLTRRCDAGDCFAARAALDAHELLVQLHDVSEPGRERVVGRAHVVPDVHEALLHAKRIQRVVAGEPESEVAAHLEDRVVDVHRELRRHVQLPAELADERCADRERRSVADLDLLRGEEREALVGEIVGGQT